MNGFREERLPVTIFIITILNNSSYLDGWLENLIKLFIKHWKCIGVHVKEEEKET